MHQPQGYLCSPHPEPPSHLLPHPIPVGCPRAAALGTPLHASNLPWSSISHMIIYVFNNNLSNHPTLALKWGTSGYWCFIFAIVLQACWILLPPKWWCSLAPFCPSLWDPRDPSTPGFPVLHCLSESAQTHVRWWCHPTISSSVTLFSFCPLSFPASG